MYNKKEQELALLPVPVSTDIKEKHMTAARSFQGIPGIAVTPEGKLWAIWYSGGIGECPENFCLLVYSNDDGETWSEPVAVVDPEGNVRAYDGAVWIDPQGRMWFFWSQTYSREQGNIFDGVAGVWGSFSEDIESDKPSWSDPVRISNGVMMNKPTLLKNGDWALPSALWDNFGKGEVPEHLLYEKLANIVISSDSGKTFELKGGVDAPQRSYDEHMIVELKDSRLWMLVRTVFGIGESFSEDGGTTWSTPEDSGLGGPNSRFFIRRLQSGNLLLINHDIEKSNKVNDKPIRDMLTAWISKDDGKTWEGRLLLDEREKVSYPDGMQDKNGNIYIIYDRARYHEGEILLAKFTEEEVLAGKISSPQSYTKRLINKTGGLKEE
ncbi:MAG: sialidase family protein [Planctomycetota bacterium]